MERREFVSVLGITLAAACTAGLAACSGGGGGGGETPGPGNNPRLTVNLSNELTQPGDFKISGGVIVIRTGAGNTPADFTALSSTCTHAGCTVAGYNKTSGLVECNAPCGHGSRFTTGGTVNTGPATTALTKFTITVSGNTLMVA